MAREPPGTVQNGKSDHKMANNEYKLSMQDAEVFLNIYGLNPTTVPPFALGTERNDSGTNTQRRFNQKRHMRQKEKFSRFTEDLGGRERSHVEGVSEVEPERNGHKTDRNGQETDINGYKTDINGYKTDRNGHKTERTSPKTEITDRTGQKHPNLHRRTASLGQNDTQQRWNSFITSLAGSQHVLWKQTVDSAPPEDGSGGSARVYLERLSLPSSSSESSTSSSSSSSSSDANFATGIRVKPGDPLYRDLLPGLDDRWRGEDRLKIMESVPYVEDSHFKSLEEKKKFCSFVNELKTNFYSNKNYYSDWDLEQMEQEKKHVLEKNDLDENVIAGPHSVHVQGSVTNRASLEISSSRNSAVQRSNYGDKSAATTHLNYGHNAGTTGQTNFGDKSAVTTHLNYGNMEPKDLEKVYFREHASGAHVTSRSYHVTMMQKKENITEYFKQQYGRKKTQFLPRLEKILFQNRYVPLFCRLFIVVLCLIALGVSARIYVNSEGSYYSHDTSSSSPTLLKKYSLGQQPSTIMAIAVNSVAVFFEVFVAVDEFKGEPLGLRNPLDKLRLILLDLLFIIFSSANLALAFGSMFDDDWVCVSGQASPKASPKINYICRKQRTLSSFLFLILCTWVVTFTISIVRVVNKASSTQR